MLTSTQLAARKGRITASRVSVLITGDAQGIMNLWLEMTDDPTFVPDDLSGVWPIRLGEVTEQLQLDWFQEKNGLPVTRRGEVVIHPKFEWAACTLDGFVEDGHYPLEVKHVGGREPLEVIIDRYQPQLHWQMFVTNTTQCALSVIMGASEPIVEYIERDIEYQRDLVERGRRFMECVRNRTPPVEMPTIVSPIPAEQVYDMTGSNEWAHLATTWLETKEAADRNEDAKKILKLKVPADAKKAHGHGVVITRNRVGNLSLRQENP